MGKFTFSWNEESFCLKYYVISIMLKIKKKKSEII